MTTEKTPTELPEPRAWQGIACLKQTSYHFVLHFVDHGDWIHFWKGMPIAVHSGRIVYFSTTEDASETRLVNAITPEDAHIRCDANAFDFIVGQVLCKAGLPLTQAAKP